MHNQENNTYSILIVEDEESLRVVLRKKLKGEDFTVHTAKNGKEGLTQALEFHPDLILLDIVMPIMDGITMLEKLREDEWGKTAPVIMLTNLGDSKNIGKAVKAGAFDYLVKVDWSLDEVVRKIKSKLKI